ncbi:hypothetical protein [Marivirga sp.]|uniref:hypothetical protein n=1 Tax=Marivirga sp. TaxID=2018662 RepID=UPI003DA7933B
MKYFIKEIIKFLSLILLVLLIGIFIPTTPRASKSLLFAKIKKDSLLENVESPRIIFIGGSNINYGINSAMIKDSLELNPINTGIHASLGLVYMMDNTLPYIRKNDLIIMSPEYAHFFGTFAYGRTELLRTVLDVDKREALKLGSKQWINIIRYFPKYCLTKLKPSEYFNVEEDKFYGVNSFNKFGDTYSHWGEEPQNFTPFVRTKKSFNHNTINEILEFEKNIKAKSAELYIVYPGIQSTSFNNIYEQIKKVEKELNKTSLSIIGNPEKYKMADSLCFNSPLHLTKEGMDFRTTQLIKDLKTIIN